MKTIIPFLYTRIFPVLSLHLEFISECVSADLSHDQRGQVQG